MAKEKVKESGKKVAGIDGMNARCSHGEYSYKCNVCIRDESSDDSDKEDRKTRRKGKALPPAAFKSLANKPRLVKGGEGGRGASKASGFGGGGVRSKASAAQVSSSSSSNEEEDVVSVRRPRKRPRVSVISPSSASGGEKAKPARKRTIATVSSSSSEGGRKRPSAKRGKRSASFDDDGLVAAVKAPAQVRAAAPAAAGRLPAAAAATLVRPAALGNKRAAPAAAAAAAAVLRTRPAAGAPRRGVDAEQAAQIARRLVPLAPEDAEVVGAAQIAGGRANEVLCSRFNIDMDRKRFRCLRSRQWLNDEVINYYMGLLQERSDKEAKSASGGATQRRVWFASTFFLTKLRENGYSFANVRRWTREKRGPGDRILTNVLDVDLIIIPRHFGPHWTCIVVDVPGRTVTHYDSLGSEDGTAAADLQCVVHWLCDEVNDKCNITMEHDAWHTHDLGTGAPRQLNGW